MNRGRSIGISVALAIFLCLAAVMVLYLLGGWGEEDPPPGHGATETATSGAVGADLPRQVDPARSPGDQEQVVAVPDPAAAAGGEEVVAETAGPLSLEGRVTNTDGLGVPEARVVVVNAAAWHDVFESSRAEIMGGTDPKKIFQLLDERYRTRMATVARARTADDGAYAFHGLEAADYRLFVVHPEHLPSIETWVAVEDGQTTRADIELAPGYVISGQVVDKKGEPVEGVTVRVCPSGQGSRRGAAALYSRFTSMFDGSMVIGEEIRTATDGTFTARSLEPAAHDIELQREGFLNRTVERVPAATAGHVLVLERGAVVRARVVDPDLRPVEGAEWTAWPVLAVNPNNPMAMMTMDFDFLGENSPSGASDADGVVEIFGLKKGAVELTVRTAEFPVGRYEIDVEETESDVGELVLERPHSISGTIRDPEGRPVQGARVWIDGPQKPGAFRMPMPRDDGPVAETMSDGKGDWALDLIPSGEHTLRAAAESFADLAVADVEAGSKNVLLQLENGRMVLVRVVDGEDREPIEGVTVSLVGASRGGGRHGTTDQSGETELRGVSPRSGSGSGDRVFAQFIHEDYAMHHQQLALHSGEDGQAEEVTLTGKRLASGRVVDVDGNPVSHARVRAEIPGVPEFMVTWGPDGAPPPTFSRDDGSFEFAMPGQNFGPMSGEMEVVAVHPAYAPGRIPVGKRKGEDLLGLEIVLDPGTTVGGTITDAEGRPVAGAQVRLRRLTKLQGQAILFASLMPQEAGRTSHSHRDGSYLLKRVDDDNYSLEVLARGHARWSGSVSVEGESVTVDVRLDPGGILAGRVVDAEGTAQQEIEVVAFLDLGEVEDQTEEQAAQARMFRRLAGRGVAAARTDRHGRYELKNFPDGVYTVVARGPNHVPAEVADLRPGDDVPDIVLGRFSSLRLKVVAAETNLPVTGYRVLMERLRKAGERRGPFDNFMLPEDVEDEDGLHVREGLRAGNYRIEVHADMFEHTAADVDLLRSEERELTVRLNRGFHVDVRVVGAQSGEGIPGARVFLRNVPPEGQPDRRPALRVHGFDPIMTDEDGLASVTTLAEGRYTVNLSHPDYFPAEGSQSSIDIPGDEGKELTFTMQTAGRIEGTLENRGDAVSFQYQVILRPSQKDTGAIAGVTGRDGGGKAASTVLRAQHLRVHSRTGRFDQSNLRPGAYRVFIKKQIFKLEKGRRTRVEEGLDEIDAGVVEIRAGQTERLTLQAPRE